MRRPALLSAALAVVLVALAAPPAGADHTDPTTRLSPVVPQGATGATAQGAGTWRHLANLGPMQGTDIEPFERGGVTYVSAGTLGQAQAGTPGFVGQRIVALTDAKGDLLPAPEIVADHGSARCTANSSATGLQHDVQAVPAKGTQLLIDTTDAVGRCHDAPGGGLEIIDVSGLGEPGFQVREIGLVRLNGLSHTVTADPARPGILYNNGSDFGTGNRETGVVAMNWTDVVDVRSCMGLEGKTLDQKRELCRPTVTRFPYEPEWTSKRLPDGTLTEPASCHDITATQDRLYCAGLNGTAIFDTSALLDRSGKVAGAPLPCVVTGGTSTGAKVTDCAARLSPTSSPNPSAAESLAAYNQLQRPAATGIAFLGSINHVGRSCGDPARTQCNTNLSVRSTDGIAVSHEADPTPDGKHLLVTDERGGGVIPPGATCAPGLDNPVGNGGLHVFDISEPRAPKPAPAAKGGNAVYIGTSPTPSPTFCTIHVIEQVEGEARIVAAYYDGGTKIVDYAVDEQGRWSFKEVASYRLPGANTWASEVVKKVRHGDGTATYLFVSSSFALGEGTARGLDLFAWTGPENLLPGTRGARASAVRADAVAAPVDGTSGGTPDLLSGVLPAAGPDRALALLVLLVLPLAALVRLARRRVGGPLPA